MSGALPQTQYQVVHWQGYYNHLHCSLQREHLLSCTEPILGVFPSLGNPGRVLYIYIYIYIIIINKVVCVVGGGGVCGWVGGVISK